MRRTSLIDTKQMKPLIKICGINDLDVLNELLDLDGIDFLGFIFYEKSIRNVSLEFLEKIKGLQFNDKRPVCVYVNSERNFIKKTSSYFQNPIFQFHGNETNEFCDSFKNDFWKVLRVKNKINIDEVYKYKNASGILFENYKKDTPGGTGESFDWNLINNIKDLDTKFILSGGINCENVDNAKDINPWCLDVNSGVESSPGIKNINLIKKLLNKI